MSAFEDSLRCVLKVVLLQLPSLQTSPSSAEMLNLLSSSMWTSHELPYMYAAVLFPESANAGRVLLPRNNARMCSASSQVLRIDRIPSGFRPDRHGQQLSSQLCMVLLQLGCASMRFTGTWVVPSEMMVCCRQ